MLVLCMIIILLITTNKLSPFFMRNNHTMNEDYKEEIEQWMSSFTEKEASLDDYHQPESQGEQNSELFYFDPNTIDDAAWKKLGLRDGQIRSIRKYLNKGGKFYDAHDFSKMYAISKMEFEKLQPFIKIENNETANNRFKEKPFSARTSDSLSSMPNSKFNKYKPLDFKVELNSSDTSDLKKLKGIGTYLAMKIVEYREKLGGYRNIDQLLEVYRMTPEKLDSIRKFVFLDETMITVMDINHVSVDRLLQHPYLISSQARALIAYRTKHGPFATVADIRKCVLIDEKTFEKLKFYLVVH